MTPLATYEEVRYDGKRQFELFPDEIHVWGSQTLQSKFDSTIPLDRLDPRIVHRWIRCRLFWYGLWAIFFGIMGSFALIVGYDYSPTGFISVTLIAMAISGFGFSLATLRSVEFAQFESTAAGVAILDIARSGPDRERFDEFVNQVLEQIRLSKGEDKPAE